MDPFIGCGRILCDVEQFRFYIDQIGIVPAFRKKGYGEFALRMLVDKANLCGAKQVWVKLPDAWDLSDPAHDDALRFFKTMHFEQVTDKWMAADIDAFHSCCHEEKD
jgi:N-acetylglutamate synthase-like GNAT family acetyltransferase